MAPFIYFYMGGVMIYMKKVGVYIITCIIMLLTALVSLIALSTLVYFLKWQSDRAIAGIVVVYILSGFVGGKTFGWIQNWQNKEKCHTGNRTKAMEALLLSMCFLFILMFISIFFLSYSFEISLRMLMIDALMIGSCFLGRIL